MERLDQTADQVHILLIEDTPEHAILVRSYLAPHAELSVEYVDTLAVGEKILTEGSFDLVILDLFLPDSSGLATLRRLRQRFPALPVIVLTGLEGQDGEDAAFSEGVSAFLTKGCLTSEQLLESIRAAITA